MNTVWTCLILSLSIFICSSVTADEVTIDTNRDAGFFDVGGGQFNLGGHTHVAVSRANNSRVNRAVFDFDIVGNIPKGATINSATFEFEVTRQGGVNGEDSAGFDLHRITRFWDEGTGAADTGEITGDGATWFNATAAETWTTPGGDFAAAVSGTVLVDGPDTYSISAAQLVADVQGILDGSFGSFGFLLKGDPVAEGSAARVTSREGGTPAKLIIDFTPDAVLLGDVNLDGVVNILDVSPFVDRIVSGEFQAEADVNQDGFVDILDISPFIALL